jgi:uncharacterized surface protein with fasciclin (FAS1) repeats
MKNKLLALSSIIILIVAISIPLTQTQQTTQDVVQTAQANGNFKTLITALDATGLTSALKGAGPFTVFAPTDAAFADVDPEVLSWLLENPDALREVLLYHVVAGAYNSSVVVGLSSVETLQGGNLTISVDGGVMINDANVTAVDVMASNGIIHVIDKVLIPELILAVPDNGIAATTIVGFGFEPSSVVTISWDGVKIPTVPMEVVANTNGMFTAIISVLTQLAPGEHNITATDSQGASATTTFTVANLTSPTIPAGSNSTQGVSGNAMMAAVDIYVLVAALFAVLLVSILALPLLRMALLKKRYIK